MEQIRRAAFAHWEGRIAPVFDVALELHLVEAQRGSIVSERDEHLQDESPVSKVLRLADLGVDVLVCGAISRSLHEMIVDRGIQVVSFVTGDLRRVIDAWLAGGLSDDGFAMPGCGGRRRRRRRGGGRGCGPGAR